MDTEAAVPGVMGRGEASEQQQQAYKLEGLQTFSSEEGGYQLRCKGLCWCLKAGSREVLKH